MKKLFSLLAVLLVFLASISVASASWCFYAYQPKTPKCLLK
jgi:cyclic lactone autoinducer peptide